MILASTNGILDAEEDKALREAAIITLRDRYNVLIDRAVPIVSRRYLIVWYDDQAEIMKTTIIEDDNMCGPKSWSGQWSPNGLPMDFALIELPDGDVPRVWVDGKEAIDD